MHPLPAVEQATHGSPLQTRRELADPAICRLHTADNIPYSFLSLLLSSSAIRKNIGTRTFPTLNVSHTRWRIDGVVCLKDDTFVYGKTHAEHDECLHRVFQCLEKAGLTLNKDRSELQEPG